MDINERKNILVTCGPGLKDYLQTELEELGFEIRDSRVDFYDFAVLTLEWLVMCP